MLWLDIAIAFSCGGGGLVCGWIMHAIGGFGNYRLVKQAAASISQPEVHDEVSQERVSEVADRLKEYAVSMAADVDAHQTKVQAVNNSLIECSDASPEAVAKAVNQLIEANEAMQMQLQQAQDQIHEQSVQIESAERRAFTDAMTRIPNRGAFDKHLKHRHSLGPIQAGTLALLDVDHFKKFNDVYGHRAGDEVLKVVASILHSRLQSFGLVARYGGEEFAVILDDCPIEEAKKHVDVVRAAIGERDIQFEDKRLRVTASGGVAELMHGETIEEWLQRADDGLYQSKEAGRNCGHWMEGTTAHLIEIAPDTNVSATSASTAHASDDETASNEAGDESAETKKADANAFAYLPDSETLGIAFSEIRGRTQSAVSIYVMAIQCADDASDSAMRSLLQVVRASMRSVDRIGCDDNSTLLICMPSVDQATALERGRQICRSAQAIGFGKDESGEHQVSVGIVEAAPNEKFAHAVSRATDTAQQCRTDEESPVCLSGFETAV